MRFTKVIVRSLTTTSRYFARPVKLPPIAVESHYPIYDPWFKNSPRGPHPRTQTGSKYTVTAIPGVGVGKELIAKTLDVFDCCGAPVEFEWIEHSPGLDAIEEIKLSLKRNGVAIKDPKRKAMPTMCIHRGTAERWRVNKNATQSDTDLRGSDYFMGNIEERSMAAILEEDTESKNFLLLESLDLYANMTVLRSFPGLEAHMRYYSNIDLVIIRSNTEGEYSLLEHQLQNGVYEHLRVITAYNTKRVSEFAFRLAQKEQRKKVTVLHQSSIMPLSEDLFVEEFLKVAENYCDIEHEVLSVRNAIARFTKHLDHFDVIVSNSLSAVQLVEFITAMIGGAQLVAKGCFNDRFAVFEPSTNSRSKPLVGKNQANPVSFLMSGACALKYLGLDAYANLIVESIGEAFKNGVMTQDMAGKATTDEFVSEMIRHIRTQVPLVICKYDVPPKINPQLPKEWAPEKSPLHFSNQSKIWSQNHKK